MSQPAVETTAKHESEAKAPKNSSGYTQVHQILYGDINTVFISDQTGFETSKTGLHQQHQNSTYNNPEDI